MKTILTAKEKSQKTAKRQRALFSVYIALITLFSLPMTIAAAPAGVDTTDMNTLIEIVFWALRLIIAAVGGIPSCIKIVQGQADENPRDRNAGIAGLVITGIIIAASFGVKAIMSKN